MRVLCAVLAVLLLFFLATPGYGQSKGTCAGYCSHVCDKTDEWTFRQSCGKMYCCIPPPKKGK
ncbi:small basic protein 1-like [Nyctibius grandis]|uniref:small basic protein 1-like n=1 Tax=Nyctibius grandis TaxID=48427 RepID=UPI0035BBA21E